MQEVGALEVVKVKADVSVARIKSSCDSFLLGDLVQLVEKTNQPLGRKASGTRSCLATPSGKADGPDIDVP